MGAYFDLAAGDAALKEHYDDQKVENMAYDDNPALAMLPKKTDATGKYWPVPVIYETSQGASNDFAIAQANQSPGLLAEFMVTLKTDYSIATLTNQAMEASADNAGAFIDFATLFVDLAIQSAATRFATMLFRTGTGSRGGISAITAGGVITLTNSADVTQFGIGQVLQATNVDGGAPRAALGYVLSRNVMAGTITVSAVSPGGPAGAPALWAANDFLLTQGDSNRSISGFASWLPATAPGAFDNHYGVNRSVDTRLYGLAYGGGQQPVEEAIIDTALVVRREKGRPKHLIFNYGTEAALIKAMGTRREYTDWASPDGEIGFRGVKVQGPAGPIECFADRSCQAATGYLIQMPTWKILSLGPVPKIFRYGDGLEMLRLANADASEVRVGDYANLSCNAPGWNSQITFSV